MTCVGLLAVTKAGAAACDDDYLILIIDLGCHAGHGRHYNLSDALLSLQAMLEAAGAVAIALSRGVQMLFVVAIAQAVFCGVDATQCLSPEKAVCVCSVAAGVWTGGASHSAQPLLQLESSMSVWAVCTSLAAAILASDPPVFARTKETRPGRSA